MYGKTRPEENDVPGALDAVVRLIGDPAKQELYLSDVRSKAAESVLHYGRYFARLLRDLGVVIPPAINLQSGARGEVCVAGDHPDKSAVEALIASNTRLVEGFKEIEVLHEIIRSQEEALLFRRLMQQNPAAAEKLLASKTQLPVFHLGITSAGPLAFFSRMSH